MKTHSMTAQAADLEDTLVPDTEREEPARPQGASLQVRAGRWLVRLAGSGSGPRATELP